MDINKLRDILDHLTQNGWGGQPLCAQHDVLFLMPNANRLLPDELNSLKKKGCHVSSDGSLAVFV